MQKTEWNYRIVKSYQHTPHDNTHRACRRRQRDDSRAGPLFICQGHAQLIHTKMANVT